MKPALWIDYSGTVEGEAAGVAVFQWPDGREHRWLTREYGCFGPRRPDDPSGQPFTLRKGESSPSAPASSSTGATSPRPRPRAL